MEPRHHFDVELKDLYQMILKLGSLVEDALRKSVKALRTNDADLAATVISEDEAIDALQIEIENSATHIIATEQPVARDLRELITTTKIAANLERIGDHARHIAKVANKISMDILESALPSVRLMSDIGISMVHESLTAFVEQNADAAREIADRDDAIDAEHKVLYAKLIAVMRENPDWIDHGVSLLFLNRFLERLGDHVTDVCQWVIFAKSGEYVELNK